jgi:Prolyl oligopeptidase family
LSIHLPDGTRWAPDRLREVLGQPVQHPTQPELFAGVAAGSGGLRCWVADASARSVTFLEPVPAVFAGGETPLAWTGSSLVVPVEVPPEPQDDARQVFEATPGQRIRLMPAGRPADRRPVRYAIVDLAGGPARPATLKARPYQRVRGAPTGQIAACAPGPDDRGTIVAVGGPDSGDEQLIQVGDGPLNEFHWLTTPQTPHLVLLTGCPAGFEISSCAVSHHAVEPENQPHQQDSRCQQTLLYRHKGRYLHSYCHGNLFILAHRSDSSYPAISYSVIIVVPGSPQPTVRILPLPLKQPTILKIAAVLSATEDDLKFATIDAENNLIIWSAPPEDAVARRLFDLTLPGDEELVTIARWDRRDFKAVVKEREVNRPLPAHPGGPAPIHGKVGKAREAGKVGKVGEAGEAAVEFSLYLPERRVPTAGLVWLSQTAKALPNGSRPIPGMIDPHWLTLAGIAVLDVRITPAWWPEVPDEHIRPRLVRQIRAAVDGSGIDRRVGPARLAVGGTSFGATLALLAIADCELFSTAIAQSGAYCRQLTPLGFQDEARTLWEAPRVYQDFDAVVNAPRIRKPVLIIHGEADQNPATPMVQATLLFQALIANGTRARLVVLSGEGHVPVSRDGIAVALSEKAAWLNGRPP